MKTSSPSGKSGNIRFYVFVAFLVLVALTGGSSRDDVVQIVPLRALTPFFIAYALIALRKENLDGLRLPFYLLIALTALIGLQLVPLPPTIWSTFAHGELITQIESTMGLEHQWRPLTLSPSKTWNSLFAMSVPLCAMLLFAIQEERNLRRVIAALIFLAIASAVVAIIQIVGDPQGPAYFYRITNHGQAVGLFANRNHNGVVLGTAIMLCAWYFSTIRPEHQQRGLAATFSIAAILLIVPVVLIANSRAGALAGAAAIAASFWLFSQAYLLPKSVQLTRKRKISGRWLVLGLGALIAGIIGLFTVFSRALAIERFSDDLATEEMRLQLLPILEQMIGDAMPFGTGFGSFEYVYKLYEPTAMLRPEYVNLAHNDWAQILIEGGLLVVPIIAIFALWLAGRGFAALREKRPTRRMTRITALIVIALLLAASLVDYPLRTPLGMVYFIVIVAMLCTPHSMGTIVESQSRK